jgi:hypothetical protein
MHILMDTGGAVTRRAELLRLAGAIERADSDVAAWRIWDTAVGVFSARHLLLPAPAVDGHNVSWTQAEPAPVTARFREHGTRAAVGRRANTPDYSAGRNAARRARSAAIAARVEAEAALRERSGSRFADWSPLSVAEQQLLLELLGQAHRGSPRAERPVITGDGRWRVTLTPPAAAELATLHGPDGAVVTLNWMFTMEPA